MLNLSVYSVKGYQLDTVDEKRRQLLKASAAVFSAAGIAGVLTPLLSYLAPSRSARAAGAPVRFNVTSIAPGEQKTVLWRGKPVWIIRRTQEMLASLQKAEPLLSDPNSKEPQQPTYISGADRSINPEYLVLIGVCTHLGCAPTYRPEPGSVDATWPGGFYCSCHGSRFDLAGRVFKNMPAPINLEVPPYHFLDVKTLVIGESSV